jgi:L-ascorbate metabolism protein UlaG (beta-lactamase superfamily)
MTVDHLTLRLVGGPTAVFEYAGLRWLTDPTFSPPGEYGGLVKTTGPALGFDELGPIDVVLLSHDHHADNLDPEGRACLPRAGRVLTTTAGAHRLGGNAIGLAPWSSLELDRPDGGTVMVTAVPALHGPEGSEEVNGPVIGFLLGGEGLERVYVSATTPRWMLCARLPSAPGRWPSRCSSLVRFSFAIGSRVRI